MDRRNEITNIGETRTRKELEHAVRDYGCEVHLKFRVADALDIDHSGLSKEEFDYATRSHFDFVVSNPDTRRVLFAVEFDGEGHWIDRQDAERRDNLKNNICLKLGMPLLRIDQGGLNRRLGPYGTLAWLCKVWFMYEEITEQQEKGLLPSHEFIDPLFSEELQDGEWVSNDPLDELLVRFRNLAARRVSRKPEPLLRCWRDAGGGDRGVVMAEVHPDTGSSGVLYGYASCHAPGFGVIAAPELVLRLAYQAAANKFEAFERGRQRPAPFREVGAILGRYGLVWDADRRQCELPADLSSAGGSLR